MAAGVPGPPPPNLAHKMKWKTWLRKAFNDPKVDNLAVLGNLLEEFMDIPPSPQELHDSMLSDSEEAYQKKREWITTILNQHDLTYFPGGRVIPNTGSSREVLPQSVVPAKPNSVEELIEVIIKGLPRAMHPLVHRRKGSQPLTFDSEYDIQDLLHALLRPWMSTRYA